MNNKPNAIEHSKQNHAGPAVLTDAELDQVSGGGRPRSDLVGLGNTTATSAGGCELCLEQGLETAYSSTDGLYVAHGRRTAADAQDTH